LSAPTRTTTFASLPAIARVSGSIGCTGPALMMLATSCAAFFCPEV